MKISNKLRGIPPEEFVGRRVKFHGHENKQHGMPCLVTGVEGNRRFLVKPAGHKRVEVIDFNALVPTWSNNQDLLARYPDLQKTVKIDDIDPVMTDDAVWVEPPVEPPAQLGQLNGVKVEMATEPAPLAIRQPRMVVKDHSAEWLPTYQKYLDSLKAEAHDRAFLIEIHVSIDNHCQEQKTLIEDLAKLGVDIVDEDGCGSTTQDKPAVAPAQPEKRRGRIAMDRFVIDTFKEMRTKLATHGEPVTGTVGGWATSMNVSHSAIQTRVDTISKVLGLVFTDVEGRTGSACRGKITLTLK